MRPTPDAAQSDRPRIPRPHVTATATVVGDLRVDPHGVREYSLDADWHIDGLVVPRPILWWFQAGSAEIRLDDERLTAGPGDVIQLAPGRLLWARPGVTGATGTPRAVAIPGAVGGPRLLSVNFNVYSSTGHAGALFGALPARYPPESNAALVARLERLRQAGQDAGRAAPLWERAIFYEIAALLIESRPDLSEPVANPHVARALRIVERSLARPPSAGALARAVGLSPSHLRSLFGESLGVSPSEYLQWRRFMLVCDRLGQSRRPIHEIAQELGFADANYFARWFSKMAGESPSRYRRRSVL